MVFVIPVTVMLLQQLSGTATSSDDASATFASIVVIGLRLLQDSTTTRANAAPETNNAIALELIMLAVYRLRPSQTIMSRSLVIRQPGKSSHLPARH
jgi:hypothetical protein